LHTGSEEFYRNLRQQSKLAFQPPDKQHINSPKPQIKQQQDMPGTNIQAKRQISPVKANQPQRSPITRSPAVSPKKDAISPPRKQVSPKTVEKRDNDGFKAPTNIPPS